MQKFFIEERIQNIFYAFIIAPLLWALATHRVNDKYQLLIIILAILILLYNLYRLFFPVVIEHMDTDFINVDISDFEFSPPRLELRRGMTIVWKNLGKVDHTVTSDSNIFNSGILKPNQTFSWKFDQLGQFPYHCTLHPNMKGFIFVE